MQFTLRNLGSGSYFSQPPLNPTRKITLREIKEITQAARVGQCAIKLPLAPDVFKHLRHRHNSMRCFPLNAQPRAHDLEELLQLAQQQVILVSEMEIKSRATN